MHIDLLTPRHSAVTVIIGQLDKWLMSCVLCFNSRLALTEMHRGISRTFAILWLSFAWSLPLTDAYYCDDNLCSPEQFCCGENICCNYVNGTIWRFICLLISVIVFGFVLWGMLQLFIAMFVIYRSRHPSARDVERDYGQEDHNLSVTSIVKHILGIFVQSNNEKSSSGASRTSSAFREADQEQLMKWLNVRHSPDPHTCRVSVAHVVNIDLIWFDISHTSHSDQWWLVLNVITAHMSDSLAWYVIYVLNVGTYFRITKCKLALQSWAISCQKPSGAKLSRDNICTRDYIY